MLLGYISSRQKKNPMNIEVFFSQLVRISRQQIVPFGAEHWQNFQAKCYVLLRKRQEKEKVREQSEKNGT